MKHSGKSVVKFSGILLAAFLAPVMITGCGRNSPFPAGVTPGSPPTTPPLSATPTKALPSATATHAPRATATLTLVPALELSMIKGPLSPGGVVQGTITTVLWSQDGATMYFVTAPTGGLRPLRWFAIDVETQQESTLTSPPRLIRRPYVPVSGFYSELDGQVSPSGRYELQVVGGLGRLGDPTPTTSSLQIIDGVSGETTTILDGSDFVFKGGEWFGDERAVMLAVGPEYGTDLYLLDIASLQLTPLSELTGFEDVNLLEWTLSPDGTMTAVVDGQGALWILPLEGGQATMLEGFSYNVRWQPDGRKLIYYHGPDWYVLETIDVFDTVTGEVRTIATSYQLEDGSVLGRPLEVAPGAELLAMWSGEEIWWMRVPAQ